MSRYHKGTFIISVLLFLLYSVSGLTLRGELPNNCGDLPIPPEHSFYKRDGKSNLLLYCIDGYYRDGSRLMKCDNFTGEWKTDFICAKKACGHPGEPKNGDVFGTNFQYGAKVSYECDECFHLEGPRERMCLHNETWSEQLPKCKPFECEPHKEEWVLEHGYVFGADSFCGSEIEFRCDQGYELIGERVLKCGRDGNWSAERPNCEKQAEQVTMTTTKSPQSALPTVMKCARLDHPENGFIANYRPSEFFDNGHVLSFRCSLGFKMVGSPYPECQPDGTWSPSPPSCSISYCDETEVAAPHGGRRIGGNRIGDKYEYECQPGYALIGKQKVTCQDNGQWSHKPPHCRSLCDDKKCKEGKMCKFDEKKKQALCVCKEPLECSARYKPVCGSDGVTYNSECIMESTACKQKKIITAVDDGNCIPGGICTIKPVSNCKGYFEVFFFNAKSNECEQIVAGGCHESGWNGFHTKDECESTCQAVCQRPADAGPCENRMQRWYYDASIEMCKQFRYGGCFGNQNNFETKEDCLNICSKPNTTISTLPEPKQESTMAPCPPCNLKVKLCDRLKTSHYAIAGKKLSEDSESIVVMLKSIHRYPKESIFLGEELHIIKTPSDKRCPCLPETLPTEMIITGDMSGEEDPVISENDYIGKFYDNKQFTLC